MISSLSNGGIGAYRLMIVHTKIKISKGATKISKSVSDHIDTQKWSYVFYTAVPVSNSKASLTS